MRFSRVFYRPCKNCLKPINDTFIIQFKPFRISPSFNLCLYTHLSQPKKRLHYESVSASRELKPNQPHLLHSQLFSALGYLLLRIFLFLNKTYVVLWHSEKLILPANFTVINIPPAESAEALKGQNKMIVINRHVTLRCPKNNKFYILSLSLLEM